MTGRQHMGAPPTTGPGRTGRLASTHLGRGGPEQPRPARTSSKRHRAQRKFTVTVNEARGRDEVLFNLDLVGSDEVQAGKLVAVHVVHSEADQSTQSPRSDGHDDGAGGAFPSMVGTAAPYIVVVKDMPRELKARYPTVELFVAKQIAEAFGLRKGSPVMLKPIEADNQAMEASHVELHFKDQHLSRSDMWRMAMAELAQRTVFKGQTVSFMETIKAQVAKVFVDGTKVHAAFFGPNTKPIFRSESARCVLFIQMAQEMWDFDSDGSGEIMFDKVVNGFLPALFNKWARLQATHLVSIVLFARVEYDEGIVTELPSGCALHDYYTGMQSLQGKRRPYKDFYRVVVSEMASGLWTDILYQLKREFHLFRRDISIHHEKAMRSPLAALPRIKTAQPSKAMYGNLLEVLALAASLFARDDMDRDLSRTGVFVVVVTASPGVFEVDYEALLRTSEAVVGNGIGIDLVCIHQVPLHSVPLFRFRNRQPQASNKPAARRESKLPPPPPFAGSDTNTAKLSSPSRTRAKDRSRSRPTGPSLAQDEWTYVVPQWLHVSYWTGDANETLSYKGIALTVADTLPTHEAGDEFVVRCRLHSLQMNSVSRSNGIETAPLRRDAHFSRNELPSACMPRRKAADHGLFIHVRGYRNFGADEAGEHALWNQLKRYDETRAKLPRPQKEVVQTTMQDMPTKGSRARAKTWSDKTVVAETSASDAGNKSWTTDTPKLTRQISLGLRGFGIAAPRAALAEINTESASGLTMSTATPNQDGPVTTTPRSPQRPASPPVKPYGVPATWADEPGQVRLAEEQRPITSMIASTLRGHHTANRALDSVARSATALDRMQPVLCLPRAGASTLPSPWLTPVNPSKPCADNLPSLCSRWQDVFASPSEMMVQNWLGLIQPASVPLTTEWLPTTAQLEADYERHSYKVCPAGDDEAPDEPGARDHLMRELMGMRFAAGFQMVVGPRLAQAFGPKPLRTADLFCRKPLRRHARGVCMTLGDSVHELAWVDETIEVKILTRKHPPRSLAAHPLYKPAIRSLLDHAYETRKVNLALPCSPVKWSYTDHVLARHHQGLCGPDLPCWRARFVFLPMPPSRGRPLAAGETTLTCPGDSEEEIRIEGIRRLVHMWLRNRYATPDEARAGRCSKPIKQRPRLERDIVFRTDDASLVLATELEHLSLALDEACGESRPAPATTRDVFNTKTLSLAALAEAMQQPVEAGGVRMQNRPWHFRTHHNCFIGSDMTRWLVDNVEDVRGVDDAVRFGETLMVSGDSNAKDGLFVHVERRHAFRNGQYFYRISSEYARPAPPNPGWFHSKRSPMPDEAPTMPGPAAPRPTAKLVLSRMIHYDLDGRKNSYRPEVVHLHYDRLHHPDNCYHIRLDWLNATPKLVDDAVERWAKEALPYGLRLVEVPLAEACSIVNMNPFRKPYRLTFALDPPPPPPPGRQFFHKALLKRFDFVLDMEAASNFPDTVDLSYSWGKPDYRHSQYVHRSGLVLAQLTDAGDFLLLANPVYRSRAAEMHKERTDRGSGTGPGPSGSRAVTPGSHAGHRSPLSSPPMAHLPSSASPALRPARVSSTSGSSALSGRQTLTFDGLVDAFEAFCANGPVLEAFFQTEAQKEADRIATASAAATVGTASPASHAATGAVPDDKIPVSLEAL